MHKSHYIWLIFVFIFPGINNSLVLAAQEHHADRPKLKQLKDIREVAKLAKVAKLPILMMFGTDECPFCEQLKEDFLIPMLISGDYTEKVIMREVHVSSQAGIIDLSGGKIPVAELINRYGVKLFPTIVFINSNGQVLVDNIIGLTTPSLFGGTLDDHIDSALIILKKELLQKNREY